MARTEPTELAVRVDKWLWAARFFKTRSLAKQAVDGGKVQFGGRRVKAARILQIGDILEIRRGHDNREVTVLQLSSRRGPAKLAQTLYQESPSSIEAREQRSDQARAERAVATDPGGRPTKKQRRLIKRFTERQGSESD